MAGWGGDLGGWLVLGCVPAGLDATQEVRFLCASVRLCVRYHSLITQDATPCAAPQAAKRLVVNDKDWKGQSTEFSVHSE